MNNRFVIVLTGGPGGGKTTLIDELSRDPYWAARIVTIPEAISLMGSLGISPREKAFQGEMVRMQMQQEDNLMQSLEADDKRIILCNRGSLDPQAYWILNGWAEMEFFTFTRTTRDLHFQRYNAVIHLVTAADGALEHYKNFPDALRPETPEQAIRLDRMLGHVWRQHPGYHRIDNQGLDWTAKAKKVREILSELCA
jgi:predicted ATPase